MRTQQEYCHYVHDRGELFPTTYSKKNRNILKTKEKKSCTSSTQATLEKQIEFQVYFTANAVVSGERKF